VELTPFPPSGRGKCLLEWEDAGGRKMRSACKAWGCLNLVALGRSFWVGKFMIQLTPQMRIVAAIEPVDFRRGIDGLARLCQEVLKYDPFQWLGVRVSQSIGEGAESARL